MTIDDQDPSISYFPQGSWYETGRGTLDAGGQHMLTSDPDAFATFTFKGSKDSHILAFLYVFIGHDNHWLGVDIYCISPLWP